MTARPGSRICIESHMTIRGVGVLSCKSPGRDMIGDVGRGEARGAQASRASLLGRTRGTRSALLLIAAETLRPDQFVPYHTSPEVSTPRTIPWSRGWRHRGPPCSMPITWWLARQYLTGFRRR